MPARRTSLVAGVAGGLVVGAFSSIGRPRLDGTLDAFVNSTSTWLVAPFLVGILAATRREAAASGLATCFAQLAGYYVVDSLQGVVTTGSLVAFWTVCAIAGGPVFGMAGHLWRTAAPALKGLGIAVLAGVFMAEGFYAYLHQQQRYVTASVWIGFGAALALVSSRGRVEQWRWLGLTVPLGLSGEAALTQLLHRFF